MDNREAIEELKYARAMFEFNPMTGEVEFRNDEDRRQAEAIDLAISALEKQEQTIDKCCETCKYERLELDAYPCSDCIRAKDHCEPYTEEES